MEISEWLAPAVVGTSFMLLGLAKLYGLARGIVGGSSEPLYRQLCGT